MEPIDILMWIYRWIGMPLYSWADKEDSQKPVRILLILLSIPQLMIVVVITLPLAMILIFAQVIYDC